MRFHIVVAAYSIWLLSIFVVFYLVHGKDDNSLQLVVMSGALPACGQILLLGVDWRGLVAPAKMWLALLIIVLLSYFLNLTDPQTAPSPNGDVGIGAWAPVVYTVNLVFILGIGTLIAGSPDRTLLRSIAGLFCILFAPLLVYIDLTGERTWGDRLYANGIESNLWGLMGLTVCLAAFARKPGPLAVAGFASGVATILQASSREHMVALPAILLVAVAPYLWAMNRPRLLVALAGACATLIAAAVLFDPYIVRAIRYLSSDVLLLDNPLRGIDSGFTGRTDIWGATFDLWSKSPLLGVGFRQHERFLAGLPAHNAYLAMMADTGLLGLIWFLALLVGSLVASWSIQDQRTRRFVMAVIVANVIIGFFDRRTINGGNPYSLFFIMCCCVALAEQSRHKVSAALRGRRRFLTGNPPLPAN